MATSGIAISQLPTAPALTGAEGCPVITTGHITAITKAINTVVTITETTSVNPFSVGQNVSLQGVTGMTGINGLKNTPIGTIGGVSGAWTITLPIDTTGMGDYTGQGTITATAVTPILSLRIPAGTYNPTFQSGQVQWSGPNNQVTGDNNLIFGLLVPNPGGVPGPFLLAGSGGGGGGNVSFWFGSDQAFDLASPGNDIGHTAGETQPGSSQRGGNWSAYAGASDLGMGGQMLIQAGTSARGVPGLTVVQGANNTDESHPAGDVFMVAGEVGSTGASWHLIISETNGVPGVGHIKVNSTNILDYFSDGRIYSYVSNGFGTPMAPWISRGPTAGQPSGWAGPGELATGTVPLAKITTGGSNGQLVIVNGLIVSITDPT